MWLTENSLHFTVVRFDLQCANQNDSISIHPGGDAICCCLQDAVVLTGTCLCAAT